MRSQRKGLTPRKTVAVYFLAFLLLTWHESGRLAGWFENLALKSERVFWSETWFKTAETLKAFSEASGARSLMNWEAALVDRFNKWPEVGGKTGPIEPAASARPEPGLPALKAAEPDQAGAGRLRLFEWPPAQAGLETGRPTSEKPAARWGPYLFELARKEVQGCFAEAEEVVKWLPEKVLLTGDSMMLEGLGPPLQKALREIEGLSVAREGRYGTGLARLDAFDWLAYFNGLLKNHQPDLVIITLGANDCQDIVIGRQRHFPASEAWNALYAERVGKILAEAERNRAMVVWVGLPIMGREPFNTRVDNLNHVVEKECARHANCRFWSTWKLMTNSQGLYDDFLLDEARKKVRMRGKDKIHLTEAGGRLMTARFLKVLEAWVEFEVSAGPEEAPDGPGRPEASD